MFYKVLLFYEIHEIVWTTIIIKCKKLFVDCSNRFWENGIEVLPGSSAIKMHKMPKKVPNTTLTHTDLCVTKEMVFSLGYSVTKEMYCLISIIGIHSKRQPKVLLKSVTFCTLTKFSSKFVILMKPWKKIMNLMIFETVSYTSKLDMNNLVE